MNASIEEIISEAVKGEEAKTRESLATAIEGVLGHPALGTTTLTSSGIKVEYSAVYYGGSQHSTPGSWDEFHYCYSWLVENEFVERPCISEIVNEQGDSCYRKTGFHRQPKTGSALKSAKSEKLRLLAKELPAAVESFIQSKKAEAEANRTLAESLTQGSGLDLLGSE